eukprot:TRINITY_DN16145_c0_g1_i4.p1 TRINITY_DN16145_c0_g1~~TRINITY_DN16145_c0_g1_i4.p1  ORF type:complete len:250 (-),score=35.43 TRINITY_DN16145_c0_g1_i4:179-928(-)
MGVTVFVDDVARKVTGSNYGQLLRTDHNMTKALSNIVETLGVQQSEDKGVWQLTMFGNNVRNCMKDAYTRKNKEREVAQPIARYDKESVTLKCRDVPSRKANDLYNSRILYSDYAVSVRANKQDPLWAWSSLESRSTADSDGSWRSLATSQSEAKLAQRRKNEMSKLSQALLESHRRLVPEEGKKKRRRRREIVHPDENKDNRRDSLAQSSIEHFFNSRCSTAGVIAPMQRMSTPDSTKSGASSASADA